MDLLQRNTMKFWQKYGIYNLLLTHSFAFNSAFKQTVLLTDNSQNRSRCSVLDSDVVKVSIKIVA